MTYPKIYRHNTAHIYYLMVSEEQDSRSILGYSSSGSVSNEVAIKMLAVLSHLKA